MYPDFYAMPQAPRHKFAIAEQWRRASDLHARSLVLTCTPPLRGPGQLVPRNAVVCAVTIAVAVAVAVAGGV